MAHRHGYTLEELAVIALRNGYLKEAEDAWTYAKLRLALPPAAVRSAIVRRRAAAQRLSETPPPGPTS